MLQIKGQPSAKEVKQAVAQQLNLTPDVFKLKHGEHPTRLLLRVLLPNALRLTHAVSSCGMQRTALT